MDNISRHLPPPLLAMVLTAGLVFLVDLMMPLGWVVWLPYIGLVFCASWLPRRTSTLILSGICTAFIILGLLFDYLYIDSARASLEVGIFNRMMGIAVLWGAAALVMRQQQIEGAREDVRSGNAGSTREYQDPPGLAAVLPFLQEDSRGKWILERDRNLCDQALDGGVHA